MKWFLIPALVFMFGCNKPEVKVINSSYWLSVDEPSCYEVADVPGQYGTIYECHFADGHVPSARCLVYTGGGISCDYFHYDQSEK